MTLSGKAPPPLPPCPEADAYLAAVLSLSSSALSSLMVSSRAGTEASSCSPAAVPPSHALLGSGAAMVLAGEGPSKTTTADPRLALRGGILHKQERITDANSNR